MNVEAALAGSLLTERKRTITPRGRISRDLQPSRAYPAGLSVREAELLRLVAMGLTDPQIAEKLVLSPRTVNAHLRSIYNKLQVGSRTAATRFAVEHHLISQE